MSQLLTCISAEPGPLLPSKVTVKLSETRSLSMNSGGFLGAAGSVLPQGSFHSLERAWRPLFLSFFKKSNME